MTSGNAFLASSGIYREGLEFAQQADAWGAKFAHGWLNAQAVAGLSWTRLLTSAILLALVSILGGAVLRLIRVRAGKLDSAHHQDWAELILSAVRKPLALLIWVYGGYFALVPLLTNPERFADMLDALAGAGGIIAIFWFFFRCITAGEKRMHQRARETPTLPGILIPLAGDALRLIIPLAAALFMMPLMRLEGDMRRFLVKLLSIFLIADVGAILVRLTGAGEQILLSKHSLKSPDNLEARKIYTQVSVIKRLLISFIIVSDAGCVLMLFEPVRHLGTSILASAGIAGIILGLAAQKTLGNVLAGIQIALSQPIRIEDVVVLEGEWGAIEEITLTYVVVRLWDLRRLVVPITYFIEKPFQNWTRQSANIIGSVLFYVDFTAPVEPIRSQLQRIVEASPLWDHQVCGLQVTNISERTVELRALVSATDAGKTFDLRCEVREKLLKFIQEKFPESLPRIRGNFAATAQSRHETSE